MTNLSHLPIHQATQFIADVFIANGVPPLDAKTVAHLMVQSDLAGADGTAFLDCRRMLSGLMRAALIYIRIFGWSASVAVLR
jgi:LDH2 family malate/lactate/ureidoglycolate dehydrogenase